MALLTGIRLPIEWVQFGFESATSLGDVVLTSGKVAWAWEEEAPDFGIASFHPPTSDEADGWGMDHVVLVVPDMDRAVDTLQATGADLRLRTVVRERPTAFFRVGTILEVIQVNVPLPGLYGVALVTEEPLEDVAARWRGLGHDVSEPRDAIQPTRMIITVRDVEAGFAVMSPDRERQESAEPECSES